MLTELGKKLRLLRIEQNVTLKDMAKGLQITAAYLSSIETGKRKAPIYIAEKVAQLYKLCPDERYILQKAVYLSNAEIIINLLHLSELQKELALAFSAQVNALDKDTIHKILHILNKIKGDLI